jgi:WD40 repeat protein
MRDIPLKLLAVTLMIVVFISPLKAQKTETIKKPGKKLYGHQRDVSALTVSHDGKLMVTGSWRNDAILWKLGDTIKKQWQFKAHRTTVEGVDISHDNKYIATCSDDANAYIWSIEKEKRVRTLGGHKSTINAISFNDHFEKNKGRFVATATNNGIVRVYDREKQGKIIRKIKLKNGQSANSVIFDKGGKYVLVGSGEGNIYIYNFLTGKKARVFKGHKDAVSSLALSPDGLQVVSGSSDQTAKIWSYAKAKVLHTLKGHSWRVLDVAFGPKGEYVVTGSNDKTARLWEVSSGKQVRVYKPKGRDYFRAVGMSPDQRYAITGSLVRGGKKDAAVLFWPTGL